MKHYGKAIKMLRTRAEMTQAKLADELNVTYQTVSKWENEVNMPDISVIENICSLFEVSVDEFLRMAENEAQSSSVSEATDPKSVEPRSPQGSSSIIKKTKMPMWAIITAGAAAFVVGFLAVFLPVYFTTRRDTGKVLTAAEIYEKVDPSVFYIEVETPTDTLGASGFFIDSNGTAVTNYHVIKDIRKATVKLYDGGEYVVDKIIGRDIDRDIAVIHVDIARSVPVKFAKSNTVRTGDKVYAIGYPEPFILGSQESTMTDGIVSKPLYKVDGVGYIQSTVDITHGNSGGVLLNDRGHVVGMTTAGVRMDNVNYMNMSVPSGAINEVKRDINLTVDKYVARYGEGVLVKFEGGENATGTVNKQTVSAESGIVLPGNEFTRPGYKFIGWIYDGNKYSVGDKITFPDATNIAEVVADWSPVSYTVKYITGDSISTETWVYGERHIAPENTVTNEGYKFKGWRFGETVYVAGNAVPDLAFTDGDTVELNVEWEPITYVMVLQFNNNGYVLFDGEDYRGISTVSVECKYGEDPLAGHTLSCYGLKVKSYTAWDADGDPYTGDLRFINSREGAVVTVRVNWTSGRYELKVYGTGEYYVYDEYLEGDETFRLPTVQEILDKGYGDYMFSIPEGYHFSHWEQLHCGKDVRFAEGSEVSDLMLNGYMTGGNKCLVEIRPVLARNTYIVKFDGGGAIGQMPNFVCEYDKDYTLPACTFEKDGYLFVGWDCGGKYYFDTDKIKNLATEGELTFTARWAIELDGAGTEQDPYKIGSYEELAAVCDIVRFVSGAESAHYALTSDIDCMNRPLYAIGYGGVSFRGTFDGHGHVIKNARFDLTPGEEVNFPRATAYMGLFARVFGGSIKNIGIENYSMVIENYESDNIYVGLVAAPLVCSYTSAEPLVRCYAEGSVTLTPKSGSVNLISVGGLIGNLRGYAENCYAKCTLRINHTENTSKGSINFGGFTVAASKRGGFSEDLIRPDVPAGSAGTVVSVEASTMINCYAAVDVNIEVSDFVTEMVTHKLGMFVADPDQYDKNYGTLYKDCFTAGSVVCSCAKNFCEDPVYGSKFKNVGLFAPVKNIRYDNVCTSVTMSFAGTQDGGIATEGAITESEDNFKSLDWLETNMNFDKTVWESAETDFPKLKRV